MLCLPTADHRAAHGATGAVGEQHRLAEADPSDDGGVPTLGSVEDDGRPRPWQRIGQLGVEDRIAHWPANASRSRPKKPWLCFCTEPCTEVSSRSSASSRKQVALLLVQLGRGLHQQGHAQLSASARPETRHTHAVQRDPGARLGARRHGHHRGRLVGVGTLEVGLQGVDLHLGAQRGCRHRDLQHHLQVVAVAPEHLVRDDVELDVQVTRRSAPRPDLAVGGQVDPVARADARPGSSR